LNYAKIDKYTFLINQHNDKTILMPKKIRQIDGFQVIIEC
jgi:hypothetical protein